LLGRSWSVRIRERAWRAERRAQGTSVSSKERVAKGGWRARAMSRVCERAFVSVLGGREGVCGGRGCRRPVKSKED
jgi:hypothetical protein